MTASDRSDELRDWYAEDEPQDGAALLDDIETFLGRFVIYRTEHERRAHTLWIAHCWFMDRWDSTPRIAFLSPEPGSGKSRALEVSEPLVPRPVHAVNCTPAYLFRKVSDPLGRPTVLYDEIDTIFGPKAKEHEEIRGVLNAGHRKGATAGRCVLRGKVVETEELPAYCAVALAGLDDLPDTLMSRSVVCRMRRRAPNEPVEPWRQRVNGEEALQLYKRLFSWSTNVDPLADGWPALPDSVTDRDADVWEALVAVADAAGGEWPKLARVAAVTLVTASRGRKPSVGVLLLHDLRTVFSQSKQDPMPTAEVLAGLNGLDESPWASIRRGEPLDARGLASRLSKYGIGSKAHRVGDVVMKGYSRSQLEDAWSRYLTPAADQSGNSSVTSVTNGTAQLSTPAELFDPAVGVTDGRLHGYNDENPKRAATSADAVVTDVTDSRAPMADGPGGDTTDFAGIPRRPGCVCAARPRPCTYCEMSAANPAGQASA